MTRHSYYQINKVVNGYSVTKTDEDFRLLETYTLTDERGKLYCDCPATVECRHVKMVPVFKRKRAIGKGMLYCYDTGEWTRAKEFK